MNHPIEKRRSKRKPDNLDAEIIAGDVRYPGIIMNFSENGLYMITASVYNIDDVHSDSTLYLHCHLPSGDKIDLNCEIKWSQKKNSPYGVTCSMGMEIVDPPIKYKEFLKTLQ